MPLATQSGSPKIGLSPWNAMVALVNALESKLNGIATGATANSSDAFLRARGNHTGTDQISDVSGLQTALNAKASTLALAALQSSSVGVVVHGGTAGTTRPSGWASVLWIGTVEPTNANTSVDLWLDTSV